MAEKKSDRQWERVPVNIKTKVVVSGHKKYFEGWYSVTNASDGGLFAEGGALLEPGTEILVSFHDGVDDVELEGRIAHNREEENEWGVGIELLEPHPGLIDRLR